MHAYNIQTGLTILFGPVFRLVQIGISRYAKLSDESKIPLVISRLKEIQVLFFDSNLFFIISSAVASLVRLTQQPTIFEVAEMQDLALLQLDSLLVSLFCLARPIPRWVARIFFSTVVFAIVMVVIEKSELSSKRQTNWKLAAQGCENRRADFAVITPIPFPQSAVIGLAVASVFIFCLRSIKAKFQGRKRYRVLFNALMYIWVFLIGFITTGMLFALAMVWRQRQHLRRVVGEKFEDDIWGFGQVAALFIWAPVPVELLSILNGTFSLFLEP